MNGLWKEKLSGWSHKDIRRKKTTKKYYIKDNYKIMLKNFYKNDTKIEWKSLNRNANRYTSSKSVQFAQRMVHKQVRTSVRDWIIQQDWDKERNTPLYEKSIAWYLD